MEVLTLIELIMQWLSTGAGNTLVVEHIRQYKVGHIRQCHISRQATTLCELASKLVESNWLRWPPAASSDAATSFHKGNWLWHSFQSSQGTRSQSKARSGDIGCRQKCVVAKQSKTNNLQNLQQTVRPWLVLYIGLSALELIAHLA